MYMDATNLKNNYNLINNKEIRFNLDKNKDDMRLREVYSDFMDYYDSWFISYKIK